MWAAAVIQAIFLREKRARIEEVKARIEYRHGIIREKNVDLDEYLRSKVNYSEELCCVFACWLVAVGSRVQLGTVSFYEIEGFIRKVTEWVDGFRANIAKFADLIQEGQTFSPFDASACDGVECLVEAQAKNGEILQLLVVLLDVLHEARVEKQRHVMVMEVHD
ncbi:hypothetical protein CTI12_AA409340 [Artemisia annua]|uniref:Uncharacterized protein n=1 Tax=Artemisia annua TaxID=35608 RepID=A0A2U1M8G6_ARTAN|nr:hypothetical protein CTI12_AA409340 [Artemisia annua]